MIARHLTGTVEVAARYLAVIVRVLGPCATNSDTVAEMFSMRGGNDIGLATGLRGRRFAWAFLHPETTAQSKQEVREIVSTWSIVGSKFTPLCLDVAFVVAAARARSQAASYFDEACSRTQGNKGGDRSK